jgi:hypothetical protein
VTANDPERLQAIQLRLDFEIDRANIALGRLGELKDQTERYYSLIEYEYINLPHIEQAICAAHEAGLISCVDGLELLYEAADTPDVSQVILRQRAEFMDAIRRATANTPAIYLSDGQYYGCLIDEGPLKLKYDGINRLQAVIPIMGLEDPQITSLRIQALHKTPHPDTRLLIGEQAIVGGLNKSVKEAVEKIDQGTAHLSKTTTNTIRLLAVASCLGIGFEDGLDLTKKQRSKITTAATEYFLSHNVDTDFAVKCLHSLFVVDPRGADDLLYQIEALLCLGLSQGTRELGPTLEQAITIEQARRRSVGRLGGEERQPIKGRIISVLNMLQHQQASNKVTNAAQAFNFLRRTLEIM